MKKQIFVAFFLFFACALGAQSLHHVLWDSMYMAAQSETIHDAILLSDRKLMLVGESSEHGKKSRGLFVLLDSKGQVIFRKTYGSVWEDVFLSGAEASDGTFYLVGYRNNGGAKEGWVVHVDENGKELRMELNHIPAKEKGRTNLSFRRIAWTSLNTGIIFAENTSLRGYVDLYEIEGQFVKQLASIGDGMVKDFVMVETRPSGGLGIAGNTINSKVTREGQIWFSFLDDKGRPTKTDYLIFKGPDLNKHNEIRGGVFGDSDELFFVGRSYISAGGDSDAWIIEYDVKNSRSKVRYYGDSSDDLAELAQINIRGDRWVVRKYPRTKSSIIETLRYNSERVVSEKMYSLSAQKKFEPKKIIQKKANEILVVGSGYNPATQQDAIQVISIRDSSILVPKGAPKIAITEFRLFDSNRNGRLDPGEEQDTYIQVKIANQSSVVAEELTVSLGLYSPHKGLHIKRAQNYSAAIRPNNGEYSCTFPLRCSADLEAGKVRFVVSVTGSRIEIPLRQELEVECGGGFPPPPPQPQPKLSFSRINTNDATQPTPGGARVATQREVEIGIKVVSNTDKHQSSDFVLHRVRPGQTIDQKSEMRHFTSESLKEDHLFNITDRVALDNGENLFFYSLGDYRSDTLRLLYDAYKPSLFVLAIGVPGHGLTYPPKDAKDFVRVLLQQTQLPQELSLYKGIHTRQCATKEETTKTAISIAFEGFYNLFIEGKIKPDDYVVVFISCHGMIHNNTLYLQTSDFKSSHPSSTGLEYKEILSKYINPINCLHKILFIDACYSGEGAKAPNPEEVAKAIEEANRSVKGMAQFMSCGTDELSYEGPEWQNGAFTKALLEAMHGPLASECHDNTTSYESIVNLDHIKKYVECRVPLLVKEKGPAFSQNPLIQFDPGKNKLPFYIRK